MRELHLYFQFQFLLPDSSILINTKCVFLLQIQVYGFNAELYHNMSEAQHKSQGLVAISLMVQVNISSTLYNYNKYSMFHECRSFQANDW